MRIPKTLGPLGHCQEVGHLQGLFTNFVLTIKFYLMILIHIRLVVVDIMLMRVSLGAVCLVVVHAVGSFVHKVGVVYAMGVSTVEGIAKLTVAVEEELAVKEDV